jgi:sugar phosphate isomerase/epimerase
MDIICASICYRGHAEDEVAATLAKAPKIGYRFMEIHGPMTWSAGAEDKFDLDSMKAAIDASGMRCAGIYTPGWGGKDQEDVRRRARSIARFVQYTEALGGDHVTSSGAEKRGAPGALERVIACGSSGDTLFISREFRGHLIYLPERRLQLRKVFREVGEGF